MSSASHPPPRRNGVRFPRQGAGTAHQNRGVSLVAARRVGVNLLWLVPGVVGGSEEYTTRLLSGLVERAPADLDLTLFALAPFAAAHPELVARYRTVTLRLDGRAKAARVAAESSWLAAAGHRRGIELMHHAGGILPPVRRAPALLTVHDLQPLVEPGNFGRAKRLFSRVAIPRSARAARLIVTPSEHARRAVIDQLGVPAERVRTVPHGIAPAPPAEPEADRRAEADVRARHDLPGPYFLYPAITYPHKNHLLLVRAFAGVAAQVPHVTLVLTGGAARMEAAVADEVAHLGLTDRVRRAGRIPRADLDTLIRHASALTVPSRFEGFGAPVLEAMNLGCPVLAADATALPEVVGDAGVLLSPDDAAAWTAAMLRLLGDAGERRRLARAGRARATCYTWDRAAGALEGAYRHALGGALPAEPPPPDAPT